MANEPASLTLLVWAVWISGQGWLRDAGGHVFADMHKEMAEAARDMYNSKDPWASKVVLFDEAMLRLEPLFLEREKIYIKEREAQHRRFNKEYAAIRKDQARRLERRPAVRLRKFIYELLGHRNPI